MDLTHECLFIVILHLDIKSRMLTCLEKKVAKLQSMFARLRTFLFACLRYESKPSEEL